MAATESLQAANHYQPLWLIDDVCAYTRLSKVYVKDLTRKKLIPSIPFGRAKRYVPDEIVAWSLRRDKKELVRS